MMSDKDAWIMSYLRRNARENITDIAKDTGIPATTIYDRVRSQEKKFVKRYVTLLDFAKMCLNTTAVMAINCSSNRQEVQKFLMSHPNINSLHRINFGCDFLAECVFRDLKEFEQFRDRMERDYHIDRMHLFTVVEELKKEGFLTKKEHFEMIK